MSKIKFNSSMNSYLARSTKNRDFPYSYISRRSAWDKFKDYFSDIWSSILLKLKRMPSYRSSSTYSNYNSIDLSHISSQETFVIGGRPPSKLRRFWKRLKAVFKDDTPRVPSFNARNQFSIKATRPSSYAMAQTRKREMSSTVDLSVIAKTLEKGRIKK